ncbi:unnamed protein product [Paramecium pentaurelia]|uniref:Uncharacterized protein n=1 Tax=Paramecium pentaurelia TaxID=43138 RepID=A0A8S1UJM4_9CILI|nr:unnamed protein product [Paramecium pentaurelia]
MQSIGSEGLKAGVTKSNIRSNVTMQKRPINLGGGKTQLGPPKTNMDTQQSAADNIVVKYKDTVVTPKELVTKKFLQLAEQQNREEEQRLKVLQKQNEAKVSQSVAESNVKSFYQSADKSSNSDVKISSSNNPERSSFMESKQSEGTYSDSDSKRDQSEQQEKKTKQKKGLKEEDLEENIPINLSETCTMQLLFIPSSFINNEQGKKSGVIQKTQEYEKYMVEKIGSDNYTKRHAQTFNYNQKHKIQQSNKIEKNEYGAFAAIWDLYDASITDQLNEFELLQEDIKSSIEKEYKQHLKNPYFLLPTELEAIKIHTERPVLGKDYSEKQTNKTKTGINTNKQSQPLNSLSGGYTNQQLDEKMQDSSSSHTGTKNLQSQQVNIQQQVTRSHGKTSNPMPEQQQKQYEMKQDEQDLKEEDYMKELVKRNNTQMSEAEQVIFQSNLVQTNLKYVERILNQNLFHKQYIQYRNYPEVKFEKMTLDEDLKQRGGAFKRAFQNKQEDEEVVEKKKHEPIVQLFQYKCALSDQCKVTQADWNSVNKDLLAVSYSNQQTSEGHIMFWTLKNPTYPERIITYPSKINCCKFSNSQPNLIAAGTIDGIVAVWDIRRKSDKPVTENKELPGKHSDSVWEVQWIGKGAKGTDKVESLVSISSDSRIAEWSMKKGLEYTNLMNLKRVVQSSQKENLQEGVNFRLSAGFSFDFLQGESSMYLAATEDGTIHRCSKSYTEQYLDNYFGHSGPVYKVRCNPFMSDIFLTCSADWSCKLWNWREELPKANFQQQNLQDEVLDFEWSPYTSTLFASVCKDGRLELWDLTKNNMLDPFATLMPQDQQIWAAKTMVRFAQNSPIIITGDAHGEINTYRLYGYEDNDPLVQQERLEKLFYPTGYVKGQKEQRD